jgi:hypothetical protein
LSVFWIFIEIFHYQEMEEKCEFGTADANWDKKFWKFFFFVISPCLYINRRRIWRRIDWCIMFRVSFCHLSIFWKIIFQGLRIDSIQVQENCHFNLFVFYSFHKMALKANRVSGIFAKIFEFYVNIWIR